MEQHTVGCKTALGVLASTLLAVLSACVGGSSGGNVVNPPPATLTSISISPPDPSIVVGATKQFKAMAGYSDGSKVDVSTSATWVSSNPNVATIQPNGLAKGIKPGSANVQATFEKITGLTILEITTTAAQDGLSLGQVNPSIAPGATLQLIAVAHYTDDSTQTVTTSATWSSNSPTATVETNTGANPGLVTGVSTGSAVITASAGGFPASTTVSVLPNAATIPLMDMTASQNYLGFQGGLYEGSKNTAPADHDAAGKAAAAAIQPLNQSGSPSSKGAIVFLSIGFSNATIEFSRLVTNAAADSKVNHATLAIEDGAHGAVTACPWTVAISPPYPETVCGVPSGSVPAENQYDRIRDTVLATATGAPGAPNGCGTTASPCLTEAQVQVIWMKNGNPDPGSDGFRAMSTSTNCASELPKPATEACFYEQQLGTIVRAAKIRYRNLKQIFFTTRIYAGYASTPLNPEPYAYEYGFSGKWLVQAQIDQIRTSAVDPVAGDLDYNSGATAWIAWGSYPWARGTKPRSDGLIWCNGQTGSPCNGEVDFEPDGTHPSSDNPGKDGTTKVANPLMSFFKTSAYTASWFCQTAKPCGP